MAEMNGGVQPGSQPASGGLSNGTGTGGFEMLGMGMGVSPPCSTVGGLSMTDVTLEQALARMQELVRENAELKGKLRVPICLSLVSQQMLMCTHVGACVHA